MCWRGGALDIRDAYSFDMPPLTSADDWDQLRQRMWAQGELFARQIADMPEAQWEQPFVDARYGTWYRNIAAMIEHSYYHTGQIALLKKLLATSAGSTEG
ncbi:MAG: hypothetical protein OHK0039_29640 [Bacteroidia bacterium]